MSMFAKAQTVENIRTEQDGEKINIYYQIANSNNKQLIRVTISCLVNESNKITLKSITGDVGDYIIGGKKEYKAVWDVLQDIDELTNAKFFVKIEIKDDSSTIKPKETKGKSNFGVKAGLNLSNMSIKNIPSGFEEKTLPSFHLGGVAEFNIAENFALEAGVLLSGKGGKYEYSETESGITITGILTVSPLYLEIPVNALYKAELGSAKLLLFVGPYIGLGVGGKIKTEYTASGLPSGVTLSSLGFDLDESEDIEYGTDDNSTLKRIDFGLNIGAGIEIKNIQIRAQYGLGLSNLDPKGSSDSETKNKVIGISIGYMFGNE